MKTKIEIQIAEIGANLADLADLYRIQMQQLLQRQAKLQQALVYATDIPLDIQTILDDSDKP